MDSENELLRLRWDIRDAVDLLRSASKSACEISGYNPGREADPEHGIPAEEPNPGWPAMGALCDRLSELADQVDAAFAPELRKAAEEAEAYIDDMADRADGISY